MIQANTSTLTGLAMMGAEQPGVVDGLKHRDYRQMLAFTEVQFLEVERASKIA